MPLSVEAGNEWYSTEEHQSRWSLESKIVETNVNGQPINDVPLFFGIRISLGHTSGNSYASNNATSSTSGFQAGIGGTSSFKLKLGDFHLFGRGSITYLFFQQDIDLTLEGMKSSNLCRGIFGERAPCESSKFFSMTGGVKMGLEVGAQWKWFVGSLGLFSLGVVRNAPIGPDSYLGLRFMLGVEI